MSNDFILEAVYKFLAGIPQVSKLDELLLKLERAVPASQSSKLESLAPVISSNTKELQITLKKAKDLLFKQTELIVKSDLPENLLFHCDECRKKDEKLSELEAELSRIKNRTTVSPASNSKESSYMSALLELEELESIFYSSSKVVDKLKMLA